MNSIQKVWIHPWSLKEKITKKESQGWLMKVLFSKGEVGYGSLSSFKNSPSIHQQIKDLTNKVRSPYLDLVFHQIWQDAKARSQNQSLLFGYPKIKNHFLIKNIHQVQNLDEIPASMIKIKIPSPEDFGRLKFLLQKSKKFFRLRLDFNYQWSFREWKKWEKENLFFLPLIDFIEDPFFNFSCWKSPFPLAWDFGEMDFCKIRIIKSLRHSIHSLCQDVARSKFKRAIFTHSLTHPLEARYSYFLASLFYKIYPYKREICGLNHPLNFFEKNDFLCFYSSPNFYNPLGTGLGFDELLEKQNWKKII